MLGGGRKCRHTLSLYIRCIFRPSWLVLQHLNLQRLKLMQKGTLLSAWVSWSDVVWWVWLLLVKNMQHDCRCSNRAAVHPPLDFSKFLTFWLCLSTLSSPCFDEVWRKTNIVYILHASLHVLSYVVDIDYLNAFGHETFPSGRWARFVGCCCVFWVS